MISSILYFQPKDHRVRIDLREVEEDAVDQFLFARDTDSTEHAARHFAEHGFHDVQPGAVLGRKDKLEAAGDGASARFASLRDVRRVVVEQEANPDSRRIGLVSPAAALISNYGACLLYGRRQDSKSWRRRLMAPFVVLVSLFTILVTAGHFGMPVRAPG